MPWVPQLMGGPRTQRPALTCEFFSPPPSLARLFWNSRWSFALWTLYMFLSSFSIVCLFALLPEFLNFIFPLCHHRAINFRELTFLVMSFFVVACVCLVITYLREDIKFVFIIFSLYVLFASTVFSVRFGLFRSTFSSDVQQPRIRCACVQLESRLKARSMGQGRGTGCGFDPQGAICWKRWKPGSSGLFLLGWLEPQRTSSVLSPGGEKSAPCVLGATWAGVSQRAVCVCVCPLGLCV